MNKYSIRDKDGRLWTLETDAKEEAVKTAIKFLDSVTFITIPKLENLLLEYGYAVASTIIPEPTEDFVF